MSEFRKFAVLDIDKRIAICYTVDKEANETLDRKATQMTTVTCQYTGIQFEASSARTKNHPLVAKFLDEASSDKHHVGAYAKAKSLLAEARGQSDDINEIMAAVTAAYRSWLNGEATQRIVLSSKEQRQRDNAVMRNFDRRDDYEEQTDGNAYAPRR